MAYVTLLVITIEACCVFLCIWIVCKLGQRITDVFASIKDIFDQFDWYAHPQAIKRMLPTILLNVQKPVDVKCFGSFAANREGCKQVRAANNMYPTQLLYSNAFCQFIFRQTS